MRFVRVGMVAALVLASGCSGGHKPTAASHVAPTATVDVCGPVLRQESRYALSGNKVRVAELIVTHPRCYAPRLVRASRRYLNR